MRSKRIKQSHPLLPLELFLVLIGAWELFEQSQNFQGDLEITIGGSIADLKTSEKKGFEKSVSSRSKRLKL